MMRRQGKFGTIIVGVTVFVILAASVSILFSLSEPPIQAVKVTQCSLSSDTIKSGESVTINCATQSNDKSNAHTITVQFSIQSTELITFTIGSTNILTQPRTDVWQYTYSQNPLSKYSQPTTANASLQSGYKSSQYEITVTFLMDNKQFDQRTLDLTVNKS
jgi:hypothetical protein